jgi:hypothetical protein
VRRRPSVTPVRHLLATACALLIVAPGSALAQGLELSPHPPGAPDEAEPSPLRTQARPGGSRHARAPRAERRRAGTRSALPETGAQPLALALGGASLLLVGAGLRLHVA